METQLQNQSPEIQLTPSPLIKRFVAALIDGLILGVIEGSIFTFLGLSRIGYQYPIIFTSGAWFFIPILVFFLYDFLMLSMYGATIGKKLVGLIVLDKNLNKVSTSKILVRFLIKFLVFVSSFWIIFDKRKRALHDIIAGTLVVQPPKGVKIQWSKQSLNQN